MEKILTIVIPTYNMQDYLRRCLDSLIVPEEQMKQLEVLVINDGSKDNSSAIAHEYQDKYPDTFRVIDKENGNYGSCVNRGLKEATGKYIKILDADDLFNNIMFSKYLMELCNCDTDIVITPYEIVDQNLHTINHVFFELETKKSLSTNVFSKIHNLQMHSITYRTALLRSIGYVQSEGISYTDTEWAVLPLPSAKNITYIDLCVYKYFLGREGQTVSPDNYLKNNTQISYILKRLICDVGLSEDDKVNAYIREKILLTAKMLYRIVLMYGNEHNYADLNSFDNDIKQTVYYNLLDNVKLDDKLPFYFIREWRERKKFNCRIKFYKLLYSLLTYWRKIKK